MSTGLILLAAGTGRRFGGRRPKQLLAFRGEPLYLASLRTFLRLPSISAVRLVVPAGHRRSFENKIRTLPSRDKIRLVDGGRFRGESVRNGLLEMPKNVSVVLIHDAARPLVDVSTIRRVERAARQTGVSLAAWPVPDTLKATTSNRFVKRTVPRKDLWAAQTPQGFRRIVANRCLLKPSAGVTDDVALAEKKGFRVKVVWGGAQNIKVTIPADLTICRALQNRKR